MSVSAASLEGGMQALSVPNKFCKQVARGEALHPHIRTPMYFRAFSMIPITPHSHLKQHFCLPR
jgi:hypothetical protein